MGIDDFPMQHGPYQSPHWDSSRVLHLYRNPLDYAVPWYFYNFQFRTSQTGSVSGPVEVFDRYIDRYMEIYLSYRKVAATGQSNMLRISYEDLTTSPQNYLNIILRWLGTEPDPSLIDRSIEYSSRDTIREFEDLDGTFDDTEDFTGKFVRDGSIGQWKDYFDDADLNKVRERLRLSGVDLDEFILEA